MEPKKIKATCLYCGMIGEMEIKESGFIDNPPHRLHEIMCPRCRRLFMQRETGEERSAENERKEQ